MNLYNNMEFEMTSSFIPNISKSDKLKILEITSDKVVIKMENSICRGVFPLDSFQYWIKKGALIQIDDHEQKTS
ncbi:hypothetical protein [Bacillus sp. T33-2]|uniref:hypothetical protein n=1 Tax=Bacillus sp. T33-2 TaxID=2054168 RepID=UPI000C7621B9|nr:hypothetical protein [Bacillus sp. T33-2]PLR89132.1 hypothetical protein CVD19_23945 [Bacillus sp. T33-2]